MSPAVCPRPPGVPGGPAAGRGRALARNACSGASLSNSAKGTVMTTSSPGTGRELRTLVTAQGTVEMSLEEVPVPEPVPDEVIVRVEPPRSTPLTSACCSLARTWLPPLLQPRQGTLPSPPLSLPPRCAPWPRGQVSLSPPATREPEPRDRHRFLGGCSRIARACRGTGTRRHVHGLPPCARRPVPRAPGRCDTAGRRLVIRQPADRTGHGRDHAQ